MNAEEQYLQILKDTLDSGAVQHNDRTGKTTFVSLNKTITHDCSGNTAAVLTTKKVAWKSAVAEMLGYLKGFDNAADFRRLGTKTWDANANKSKDWLDNPNRKGKNDLGRIYGVQLRDWKGPDFSVDQLKTVYYKLVDRKDDRRLIMTFWNPGEMHLQALPACMHTHQFSLLGDTLHLTSYQRSGDLPLGVPFNMVQTSWLLIVMAKITGLRPGTVTHHITNAHIYTDQLPGVLDQLQRKPLFMPRFVVHPKIGSLDDLLAIDSGIEAYFTLPAYSHHEAIHFPFAE